MPVITPDMFFGTVVTAVFLTGFVGVLWILFMVPVWCGFKINHWVVDIACIFYTFVLTGICLGLLMGLFVDISRSFPYTTNLTPFLIAGASAGVILFLITRFITTRLMKKDIVR